MKSIKDIYKIKGFTIIELMVVIVILGILGSIGFSYGRDIMDGQKDDMEQSQISQLGSLFAGIINKDGDVPVGYCRNTDGTYGSDLSNCIDEPNNGGTCDGKIGDLANNPNCNKGCVIINCKNGNCTGNNKYYDFEKLMNDRIKNDLDFKLIYNNLSFKICSLNNLSGTTIGKANEGQHFTFNPSFSLYHKGSLIYQYNSNP